MVLRRSDVKQNHKDAQNPSADCTKRTTKVHAQRKFAQGSGMNSPIMTPVKEKKSKTYGSTVSPTPSVPTKRPRTEDFITFLCYRGTEKLPTGLNYFNTASKPEKGDRELVSPGSSKQSPNTSIETKSKLKKNLRQSNAVILPLKNKIQEKRLSKHNARLNKHINKGNGVLLSRKVGRPSESSSKVAVISGRKQLLRGRAPVRSSHPAILKRLSASRVRSGLRSGGQVQPASESMAKTEGKPKGQLTPKSKLKGVSRKKIREVGGKARNSNPAKTPDRKVESPIKTTRNSRRSRGSSGSPITSNKNLDVSGRPSRKTKEAATIYMEMITKDLRSPDEDYSGKFDTKNNESVTFKSPEIVRPTRKNRASPIKNNPKVSEPEANEPNQKKAGTRRSSKTSEEKPINNNVDKKVGKSSESSVSTPNNKTEETLKIRSKRTRSNATEDMSSESEPGPSNKTNEVSNGNKAAGKATRRTSKVVEAADPVKKSGPQPAKKSMKLDNDVASKNSDTNNSSKELVEQRISRNNDPVGARVNRSQAKNQSTLKVSSESAKKESKVEVKNSNSKPLAKQPVKKPAKDDDLPPKEPTSKDEIPLRTRRSKPQESEAVQSGGTKLTKPITNSAKTLVERSTSSDEEMTTKMNEPLSSMKSRPKRTRHSVGKHDENYDYYAETSEEDVSSSKNVVKRVTRGSQPSDELSKSSNAIGKKNSTVSKRKSVPKQSLEEDSDEEEERSSTVSKRKSVPKQSVKVDSDKEEEGEKKSSTVSKRKSVPKQSIKEDSDEEEEGEKRGSTVSKRKSVPKQSIKEDSDEEEEDEKRSSTVSKRKSVPKQSIKVDSDKEEEDDKRSSTVSKRKSVPKQSIKEDSDEEEDDEKRGSTVSKRKSVPKQSLKEESDEEKEDEKRSSTVSKRKSVPKQSLKEDSDEEDNKKKQQRNEHKQPAETSKTSRTRRTLSKKSEDESLGDLSDVEDEPTKGRVRNNSRAVTRNSSSKKNENEPSEEIPLENDSGKPIEASKKPRGRRTTLKKQVSKSHDDDEEEESKIKLKENHSSSKTKKSFKKENKDSQDEELLETDSATKKQPITSRTARARRKSSKKPVEDSGDENTDEEKETSNTPRAARKVASKKSNVESEDMVMEETGEGIHNKQGDVSKPIRSRRSFIPKVEALEDDVAAGHNDEKKISSLETSKISRTRRKPSKKSYESENEDMEEEKTVRRPKRNVTRNVVKELSSADESEASESKDVSYTRTRPRRNNIRYLENDSDDDDKDDMNSRPKRIRKSYLHNLIDDYTESDESEFEEKFIPSATSKGKNQTNKTRAQKIKEESLPRNRTRNTSKDTKLSSSSEDDTPENVSPVVVQKEEILVKPNSRKPTARPKLVLKTEADSEEDIGGDLLGSLRNDSTDDSSNSVRETAKKMKKILEDSRASRIKESIKNIKIHAEDKKLFSSDKHSADTKRIKRRISRDQEISLRFEQEKSIRSSIRDDVRVTRRSLEEFRLDDVTKSMEPVNEGYRISAQMTQELAIPNELKPENSFKMFNSHVLNEGHANALDTLAEAASLVSEQNKRTIGRGNSSDSNSSQKSHSIDLKNLGDVPEKDQAKTKSSEDLTKEKLIPRRFVDEDSDSNKSSYDGDMKDQKSPKRTNLPRRTRKEPTRIPSSQRPLTSRRAKGHWLPDANTIEDSDYSDDSESNPSSKPSKVKKGPRKSFQGPHDLMNFTGPPSAIDKLNHNSVQQTPHSSESKTIIISSQLEASNTDHISQETKKSSDVRTTVPNHEMHLSADDSQRKMLLKPFTGDETAQDLTNFQNVCSTSSNSSMSAVTSSKPVNLGKTWIQAFKNAKIPKPGQSSPAPQSSAPFVRKPFASSPSHSKSDEAKKPSHLPNMQSFKSSGFQNLNKLGGSSPVKGAQSPSRVPSSTSGVTDAKSHVYRSPTRTPVRDHLKPEEKKQDPPAKTLTQLQYEKRSQELISSLKDSFVVDSSAMLPTFSAQLKGYNRAEKEKPKQSIQTTSEVAVKPPKTSLEGGKHLNLPLAVDHTLRKMSPTTVSKKPLNVQIEKKSLPKIVELIPKPDSLASTPQPQNFQSTQTLAVTTTTVSASSHSLVSGGNVDMLLKKKVNMTNEEIKRWLNDSTSKGIEHKNCGIFENNGCSCGFRTSGDSMKQSNVSLLMTKEESKVDHGVVQPPVQLKELDTSAKFTAETISTCKVEDYKEKLLSKSPKSSAIIDSKLEQTATPPVSPQKPKKELKKKGSMTEEEMCDFDFRFERNSNSPRESGSELSTPPPLRDDVSSSNEENQPERKPIFQQRRAAQGAVKRPPLSKSPCAFSADNESSVYAFVPDPPPPPNLKQPFRRRSRQKSGEEECPASSSIAVQVNLETEQVLECSTQTEQPLGNVTSDGQLFYFPIEEEKIPSEVIQGVQLKLQRPDGPQHGVIMRAKLVTKPSTSSFVPSASSRPLSENASERSPTKPEQKVRPLPSTSSNKSPPVQTVQPTLREPNPSTSSSSPAQTSQGTTMSERSPLMTSQEGTQTAARPNEENKIKTPAKEPKEPVVKDPPSKTTKKNKDNKSTSSSTTHTGTFPLPGTTCSVVDAPTFYPTEKEFQDPLEYIEQITPQAESFGICRIVPPANFKPECKVSDDMRFTAYNQYVHKMLYRWGPNVREMLAIKKYLATQSISLNQPPYIGGIEMDLPRLYQTVQTCGGLKEVMEKKRWAKVADAMKIPKSAQDRVTKLDDIYCKYLLPYDTLSHVERAKLLEDVDIQWKEREEKKVVEDDKDQESESENESEEDGLDECITKGRTMPLCGFYRIARNTMAMWFKETNPSAKDVEAEFWKQVTTRKIHICVNSGSIDSGSLGYGFPTSKSSATAKHSWNLKVLTNNSGSILRFMGPVIGVTSPTLHVGMLFSACCWYRDPHGLPWIEYLHTGANKIWYGVPDSWSEQLRQAMKSLLPKFYQDKPIWLASDTAMVPPEVLNQSGVSLCRTVQEPGQFILVFPKAFTSTVCTGYVVSESVYFAQPSWLTTSSQIFKDIQESCESPVFSLEKLLFNIAADQRSSAEVLSLVLPKVTELKILALAQRKAICDLGITDKEKLSFGRGKKKVQPIYECEICRGNLFLTFLSNSQDDCNNYYCVTHGIDLLKKEKNLTNHSKLIYTFDEKEMDEMIDKVKSRIEQKTLKKMNKHSGGSSSKN